MNKIKLFATCVGISSIFVSASPVFAVNFKNVIQDRKEDRREDRRELGEDLRERVASKVAEVKSLFKVRASFGAAKLTAINGATLTVEKDGKSITVNTGSFDKCKTQFRRRFWGSSGVSEYTVGDLVNVIGSWTDDSKTAINACVVRDISIQKRFGVFIGEVLSLTGSGWTMTTVSDKRENQAVTVTASTKFVNRKGETITQADIKAGQKVRVRGLWNRVNNTVTEVTEVKDYSIPVKPTVTPTPTP